MKTLAWTIWGRLICQEAMKAPIHSVDNSRPFMPWDDRSCCLKCSPQWLPRWHMHGRRDSFLWTHCRPAHHPGSRLKFARKSSNPRNEKLLNWSCSVLQAAAFNLWLIIFGTWNRWVPFRTCLVNSFLVMVVMWMMVVVMAVITIVLVILSLLGQIPWLPAAWLPPPLSYSSKPRPN